MNHRGIRWLGAGLLVVFAGALVFAVLAARGNRDAVPGSDTIASLGVIPAGYLVGTTGGLTVSPDGRTWSVAHLPRAVVAVASSDTTAYVLAGGVLRSTTDLHGYATLASGVPGTVIAAAPGGGVEILAGRRLISVGPSGGVAVVTAGASLPSGLTALAVQPDNAQVVLAGGPIAGLWKSTDGGRHWFQLVKTPTQSVLFDPGDPQRILLGTVAGVLVSARGGFHLRFTSLRLDIHGLGAQGGKFYAVSADRRLFVSPDGLTGWNAVVPG